MTTKQKAHPFDAVRSAVDKDKLRSSLAELLEQLTDGEDGWRAQLEQLQTMHAAALNQVAYLERGDRFEAVVWHASEARAGIENWSWAAQTREELLGDIGNLLEAIDNMPSKPNGGPDDELTIPPLWDLLNPQFESDWEDAAEDLAEADVAEREKTQARAAGIHDAIDECELVIELADQAKDAIEIWFEAEGRDEKADAREDATARLSELVDAVDDLAASEARIEQAASALICATHANATAEPGGDSHDGSGRQDSRAGRRPLPSPARDRRVDPGP
jgi:hypothetical protein